MGNLATFNDHGSDLRFHPPANPTKNRLQVCLFLPP
jgi:hypothetical protein